VRPGTKMINPPSTATETEMGVTVRAIGGAQFASNHTQGDAVHLGQTSQIGTAGVHPYQVCVLRLYRPERCKNRRGGREELGLQPELLGGRHQRLLQAVRGVAVSVEGLGHLQHERGSVQHCHCRMPVETRDGCRAKQGGGDPPVNWTGKDTDTPLKLPPYLFP
jgi:hypothetical protein